MMTDVERIKLMSRLCDYSDADILVKGTVKILNTEMATNSNNTVKKVIFKNCAPFTNWINKINNTQADNAKDVDVVILIYQLIEYSDIHSKTSGSLRRYKREEPALTHALILLIFLSIIIIVFRSGGC